jgi:hypothetical protein
MAINPNTDFTPGAIFTAGQADRFPRGVMAYAQSTTNYQLTLSAAVSTGMTVTFTAEAGRYYKVTYYEPQAQTSSTQTAQTQLHIRLTNAAGTLFNVATFQQAFSGGTFNGTMTVQTVQTFSAGAVTLVGCSFTNVAAGTPNLVRSATQPAFLLVEDIGQS